MYKAIYRKYRPKTFRDVVGQTHVVRTLENAITQSKVGHAYLFHGPRGTGKTSIAKIFAAAVNCENIESATGIPCHICASCQLIDTDGATDIIELDAASNNGVDEIRQIREYARYAPTNLKYKVYIIDEVHMLSTAAFNALLKTLEEPPKHVIFILATTEAHKIPQTIISRCQRFDFKKITIAEMCECLKPILEKEQVEMTDEAMQYLAEYADGGMRDALSVLDQAIAYCGSKIQKSDIQDVVGTVSESVYQTLIQNIIDKSTTDTMQILKEIIDNGKNIQLFVEEFLKYLLQETEKTLCQKGQYDAKLLFFLVDKLNTLAATMKMSFLPQVALQALFLELTFEQATWQQAQETELSQMTITPEGTTTKTLPKIEEPPTPSESVENTQITEDRNIVATTTKDESIIATSDEDILNLFDEDYLHENLDDIEESTPILKEQIKVEEVDLVFDFKRGEAKSPDTTNDAPATTNQESPSMAVVEPVPTEQVQPELIQHTEKALAYDAIQDEKTILQLQRIMSEVVIYPEYNQLEKIKRRWQLIQFKPNEQIIVMLLDMEPKIATKTEIVLSCYSKSLANQLRLDHNLTKATDYVAELVGQGYKLIITDEAEWQKQRQIFAQKYRENQISEETLTNLEKGYATLEEAARAQGYEYVALDFGEENQLPEEPIVEEAKNLFGDLVEVIEE